MDGRITASHDIKRRGGPDTKCSINLSVELDMRGICASVMSADVNSAVNCASRECE